MLVRSYNIKPNFLASNVTLHLYEWDAGELVYHDVLCFDNLNSAKDAAEDFVEELKIN